jgi:hypothetical protein
VRARALLIAVVVLAVLLAGCGDESGSAASSPTAGPAGSTPTTLSPGTVLGPTEGEAACADLADRYVARARVLFDRQGTPPDALVDRIRTRFVAFDTIAAQAGCGEEYTRGVCEGLDALTEEGILVILPLTTAQCL